MKLFQKLIKVLKKFKLKQTKSALNGKTINLTGDNTIIKSTNFNVDKNGNMTCSSANITDGNIVLNSNSNNYEFRIFNNTTGVTTKVTSESLIVENNEGKRGNYQAGAISLSGNGQTFISENYASFGGDVYGRSFNPTSLESQKKNFEKLKNGLNIIKNIEIYKYNFKDEDNEHKKHIGFVIGKDYEYSNEITSLDNEGKENGVEIYSFVSVCCKAIQEQQEQIEQLQKEIKELKGEK